MKIAVPEPVQMQGLMLLRSERMGFSCSGVVRHCVRCGASYLVGLEFTSRLKLPPELAAS